MTNTNQDPKEPVEILERIGCPSQKIKETVANKKLCQHLIHLLKSIDFPQLDWQQGFLVYEVATLSTGKDSNPHIQFVLGKILDGSLQTKDQITAAWQFIQQNATASTLNSQDFVKHCGVGLKISDSDIKGFLKLLFDQHREQITSERYRSLGSILKWVRDDAVMKWADGKIVKTMVDQLLDEVLGGKDERDVPQKKTKGAKKDESLKKSGSSESVQPASTSVATDPAYFFSHGELSRLHKPGENPQIDPKLMAQHLKETGGLVMTRFPPEPNGYLHIGHAKAINVSFGYAKYHNGKCYLRYDDTNPEAEEEQFFTSIKDSVEWLGFKPWKITYSSDYFQQLYELAVKMIQKDKAYICHCTGEEIHKQRGGDEKGPRYDCPHRYRPIEESLKEFDRMKKGEYKEGEAILRMKMDMQHPSPQFWDLVAYRVLYTPHFRSGSDWVIYPTYDYTHCLCDSFENITHSLCTTEFRMSRESYYWLCDVLEVYKPVQWEYGRLNLTNTVLSKRKLTKLVEEKIVRGWDDPRIYTLVALKRRGFPPEAINNFVRECGVTTAVTQVDVRRLEYHVRQYLDDHAPRVMAVLDPLPVLLVNVPANHYELLDVPFMPKSKIGANDSTRTHQLPFTNILYLDRHDYRSEADPNFFRLTKKGNVNLLYLAHSIYCHNEIKDGSGKVVALECYYLDPKFPHPNIPAQLPKAKSYIQWVPLSCPTDSQPDRILSPHHAEVRVYNDLFLHKNPMDKTEVPGGWLSDINPNSLEIHHSLIEPGVGPFKGQDSKTFGCPGSLGLKVEEAVQFQRLGYFAVDPDSDIKSTKITISIPTIKKDGHLQIDSREMTGITGWVFNRTVSLREDAKKD